MQYTDITEYNATSFTSANRTINDIDTIVIHHWDDPAKNPQLSGTSAHFVVEAGRCAQLVEFKDIAWHAGNWAANQRSIGIECRPEMSNEDFETVAQLIADIETYYGKSFYVHGHKDFFNTACPGRWYNQLDRLIDRVNAIKEGKVERGVENVPAPLDKAEVSALRASWEKLQNAVDELGKEIDNNA